VSTILCDQCGGPIDPGNTGTICTGCLQSVMQAAGFKGLVQATSAQRKTLLQAPQPARPILLGQPQVVSVSDPIYVEYPARVLVEVDPDAGTISNAITVVDKTAAPTGNVFMSPGSSADFTPAVVPAPPPKFSSPEEADAWLEANVGKAVADAVEITQDQYDQAMTVAKGISWEAWV
jgi:hypothetical protein